MARKRTKWSRQIIDAYCKAHPDEQAIVRENLAQLICYDQNRKERNADFIALWQEIKAKTHAYVAKASLEEMGSKEYKNVISIYMGLINYTRPQEEDALMMQIMAALDLLEADDSPSLYDEN